MNSGRRGERNRAEQRTESSERMGVIVLSITHPESLQLHCVVRPLLCLLRPLRTRCAHPRGKADCAAD